MSRTFHWMTVATALATGGCSSTDHGVDTVPQGAAGGSTGGSGASAGIAGASGAGGSSGSGGSAQGAGGKATAGVGGAGGSGAGGGAPQEAPVCIPGAPPVKLAAATKPTSVVVDGDALYWMTFGGMLQTTALSSASASTAATTLLEDDGRRMLKSEGSLFWITSGSTGAVRRAQLPMPTAFTTVALSPNGTLRCFTVLEDDLFFVGANHINRVSASKGGEVTTVLTDTASDIFAVAADASNFYYIAFTPTPEGFTATTTRKAPRAGGASTEIAKNSGPSDGDIALSATHVYWTTAGGISRQPKAGGKVEELAKGGVNTASLAVDGDTAYWVNRGSGGATGEIMKRAADGQITKLATGQQNPIDIAVDATCVYWVEYVSSGAVWKVAR